MSEQTDKVIAAARTRVGTPFRHHYKPLNTCKYGRVTHDECMTRGMDQEGYDCSGLVIASLCEILQISPADWPRDRRHAWQMQDLVTQHNRRPGDILLIEDMHLSRFHPLISSGEQSVIHADGHSGAVVEKPVLTTAFIAHVIPLENLIEVIQ